MASGTEPSEPRLIRFASFAHSYWPDFVVVAGQIAFGILLAPTAWRELPGGLLVRLVAFLTVPALILAGTFFVLRRGPLIAKLQNSLRRVEQERDEARSNLRQAERDYAEAMQQARVDYRERFRDELRILASETLKYGHTERVSVYRFKRGVFVLLGRYSDNPDFSQPGRTWYASNEGIIGRAWREARAFIGDLPDPELEMERYLAVCSEDYKLDRSVVLGFAMKSRSYAAYALRDLRQNEKRAIIVFESTRTDVLRDGELWTLLQQGAGRRIMGYLDSTQMEEPDPVQIAEEGL